MNFSKLTAYVLLEGVAALFSLAAFIYILAASLKLVRANHAPGSRLMLGAILFTLFGALLSGVYPYIFAIEENALIEAAISVAQGIAFFAGAYGFWRLAKHVIASAVRERPPSS